MRCVFEVHVANDTTRTDLTFDIYATLTFIDLCSGKFLPCLIQKLSLDIQTDRWANLCEHDGFFTCPMANFSSSNPKVKFCHTDRWAARITQC